MKAMFSCQSAIFATTERTETGVRCGLTMWGLALSNTIIRTPRTRTATTNVAAVEPIAGPVEAPCS